jgi:DNA repair exonuclease SbcCD nuclease subunit
MFKVLRLTDPHITVPQIKDSDNLIDFVVQTAKANKVDWIEILGDLFDNHAVKRLEVEDFWKRSFDKLKDFEVRMLVGNHDKILGKGKYAGLHSLSVFKNLRDNLIIIDEPKVLNNTGYIPYIGEPETFIKYASDLYNQGAKKLLLVHETFDGSKFASGFYAKDGIDLNAVPQEQIISGHIHTKMEMGKLLYLGTPKWDEITDANQDKGIWIFTQAEDGSIVDKQFISTKDVVPAINKIILTEGEVGPELNPKHINYLELYGSSTWIKKMKKKFDGIARISSKPTDRKSAVDRKSSADLASFLNNTFKPAKGVKTEDIKNYLGDIFNG